MTSETPDGGSQHNAFLNLLRASNDDFRLHTARTSVVRQSGADSQPENDDTVRASNVPEKQHRTTRSLSDLFVPPTSPSSVPRDGEERKSGEPSTSPGHPPIRLLPAAAGLEGAAHTQHENAISLASRPPFLNNLDRGQSVVYKVDDDESLRGVEIPLEDDSDYSDYVPAADCPSSMMQPAHRPSPPIGIHSLSPKTKHNVIASFLQKHPDGSLKRGATIKRQDRAVSFEGDTMQRKEPFQETNSNYLHHRGNGPDSARTNSFEGIDTTDLNSSNLNNPHRRRLMSDNRILNLAEILTSGPYEVEAETNILKALEDHQPANWRHQSLRSETSTILSGIPDSLGHNFSLDEDEGDDTVQNSPSSPEGIKSNCLDPQQIGIASKSSSDERIDLDEGMPLLKAENRHRRTMSVEDRLAGVAIEYHNLGDSKGKSQLLKGSNAANRPADNASSGEAFRHNVTLPSRSDDGSSLRGRKSTDKPDKLPCLVEGDEESPAIEEDASDQGSIPDQVHGTANNSSESGFRRRKRAILFEDEWEVWWTFFSPRGEHILTYAKVVFLYLTVPLIGISAVLFYGFENPPTGLSVDGSIGESASVSWWLLYFMRQVITLSLALFLQILVVDFFSIGTRVMLKILGPILTLLIVQSRGWPFVFFWWSILDFAMLYGDRDFARHWLYWQGYVGLFNAQNPSGQATDSIWNTRVLAIVAVVSTTVAIKRFAVGLYLSRNTFSHYGEELAKLMHKMILISHVAQFAKKLQRESIYRPRTMMVEAPNLAGSVVLKQIYTIGETSDNDDDKSTTSSMKSEGSTKVSTSTKKTDIFKNALDETQKMKLFQLLDDWEEPEQQIVDVANNISISAVLRFRNALNLIQNDHAFSLSFGPTHSREACVESSQHTYIRLLKANPADQQLHFDTLGLIALGDNGEIDLDKATDLVKIFRPRRDGVLTMLDFVKSTDKVYKEYRLLQASIQNSSQIDRAFENILNVFFYTILITIILGILGFDPLALFLSLSSVILAFAFMIGSASSKYFEGILFILVRRPYGIGDIIHVSGVENETSQDGSMGWIVQKVTLFETVATWLPTFEKASFSNGSLASSRIINWARSPNARINIQLHFPIETKYEQIEIFKGAVEEYMKVRPREWLKLIGFRVNRIYTEQSYMQVTLLIQHREPWQSVPQVLDSKANLVTYCNEVQKKLGMKYRAPPLPVDLRSVQQLLQNNSLVSVTDLPGSEDLDLEPSMNQFRLIAKTRHRISQA